MPVGANRNTSYAVDAKRFLVGISMKSLSICQRLRDSWSRQTEMTKALALAVALPSASAVRPSASAVRQHQLMISNHPSATHSHHVAAVTPLPVLSVRCASPTRLWPKRSQGAYCNLKINLVILPRCSCRLMLAFIPIFEHQYLRRCHGGFVMHHELRAQVMVPIFVHEYHKTLPCWLRKASRASGSGGGCEGFWFYGRLALWPFSF